MENVRVPLTCTFPVAHVEVAGPAGGERPSGADGQVLKAGDLTRFGAGCDGMAVQDGDRAVGIGRGGHRRGPRRAVELLVAVLLQLPVAAER